MAIFSNLELQGIMNRAEDDDYLNEDHVAVSASADFRDTDAKIKKHFKDRAAEGREIVDNLKNKTWIVQKKSRDDAQKKPSGKKKITFKEDANGNIIDCTLEGEEEYFEEGKRHIKNDYTDSGEFKLGPFKSKTQETIKKDGKNKKYISSNEFEMKFGDISHNHKTTSSWSKNVQENGSEPIEEGLISKRKLNKAQKDAEDTTRSLYNKATVEIEKEKQDWESHPGAKTGEFLGDVATGGNLVNTAGKKLGRGIGSGVDKIIKRQEKKRKAKHEDTDWRNIYRSEEYTRAMNEFFDITDTETRKVLLAVNEADQNKVLVSLTSKLYDNVVDRVDDIDFGEIERTKGDIEKLPNFTTLHECLNNMARLLIEFKQDTKPVDTIAESVSDIIESKPIWTKAYAINAELPMITYNTIVLAIIEATSYMVSMCVEFVKSPSQDTMQIMIDRSALTKSKGHLLFKNLESFNDAYRKGQVEKAMTHILDETVSKKTIESSKKNFIGGIGFYTGGAAVAAVVGVAGLLFCIIPIIRELIFLFFYYRVKISDFFEVQADLLQVNSYNVQNNRLDLTKDERKKISNKQMKVAEDFRKVARKIAIDGVQAEKSASKDIKSESNKKYKADEIMDELPDSASSALF